MTWPTVKLGDVCLIRPPKSEVKNRNLNNNLVSFMGMEHLGINTKIAIPTITKNLDDVVGSYTYFAENDVLLAKITPCFENGKAGIARNLKNGIGFGSSEFLVLRAKERLLPDFLYYFLSRKEFIDEGAKNMSGAVGHKRINIDFINNYLIPLPPFAEQQRIAAILDKAAEIKRKREQAIAKLDELAQSTFVEMFGDRKANPKGFTVTKLNEITAISSGSTPSRSTNGYMNGTFPWVKTAEVDGVEIYDTEEKLTEAGLSSIGNKLNQIDSIVVAMYGQGKTRGRVGLLKTVAATNQACGVIKPNKSFLPNFMFWQLHLAYSDLRALGRGGNQENLNLQLLGNFEVLLPPLNAQEKYSNFVRQLQLHRNRMQVFHDKTSSLSSSLQHQAFSTGFRA